MRCNICAKNLWTSKTSAEFTNLGNGILLCPECYDKIRVNINCSRCNFLITKIKNPIILGNNKIGFYKNFQDQINNKNLEVINKNEILCNICFIKGSSYKFPNREEK